MFLLGFELMPQAAKQLSLFHVRREVVASAGFVAGMKAAMRRIVEASGKSRDQVVDGMNEIVRATGKGLCKGSKNISLSTLEKWLADEERGQLPDVWGLHVLMLATGRPGRNGRSRRGIWQRLSPRKSTSREICRLRRLTAFRPPQSRKSGTRITGAITSFKGQ
jgi:hypothetical protein